MEYQFSTPQLDFDVLAGVFAHVERKGDVSSLMKTCKTLYRPAIPHLLRDGVTIWTVPEAKSFCRFMLAKHWNKDRIRYLSHLRIHVNFHKGLERLALNLAKVIRCAVRLEELEMEYLEALLVAGDPKVFEFLQDLKSHRRFKKLSLQDVGEATVQLLGSMVSNSIANLSLSYDFEMGSPDSSPALRSLAPTITTLDLEWIYPRSFTVRCPLLRTLSLQTYYSVVTRALVFAFPNLRCFYIFNETESYDEDEIADLRLSNQIDLGQPHGSWTHLHRLHGDTNQLYIMGLSCPVYELDVSVSAISDMPRVLHLFDDVSPQMVNLRVYLHRLALENFVVFLPTVIPFLNNSCSHLSLYVQLTDETFDTQEFMAMLVSVLSRAMLCLLEIRLDYTLKKDFFDIGYSSNEVEPDPVGDYFLAMDMESFVLQIAQQIPTLGHIGVELSCVKDPQTYWKIIRSSESTQVSLLNVGSFRGGHAEFWQTPEEMQE